MNRYRDIDTLVGSSGMRYKRSVIYPEIPLSEDDIYILTTIGDRYDTLAQQFYKDSSLWWVIAMSNNSERSSLIVEPGIQLRIPSNPSRALDSYNTLNKIR